VAYSNFKPTVWSKYIQHELEKFLVFADITNRKFEGEAGEGKTVKIIGAHRPTVGTYTPGSNISAAETPADSSIMLAIDQYKYTHFMVDDVDKAQAVEGLMQAYMEESVRALAENADTYIASLASGATYASTSAAITTATAAKKAINDGLAQLYANGVQVQDGITIVLPAWLYVLFRDSMTIDLTNNEAMVRKGIVGQYAGATVKLSNNVYNDSTDDYSMILTKNAIAYASGIEKTEAYRPDLQFTDAVKTLHTYGAKIIRPAELYVIKARKA